MSCDLLTSVRSRWWLLFSLLLAAGLIAASCTDDDFDGAPDDRGAAAAAIVGATERDAGDDRSAQAAEPDATATYTAAEEQAAPATESDAADAGSTARGQELFFANGCNICHGDQGPGGIGPTIAATGLSLDQVIAQYRSPRGTMPPFPADRVPDGDVAEIYAWLQTLDLPDTIVPGEGTP